MARSSQLEEQLSAATRRFVAEVVFLIRSSSVADVAGFDPSRMGGGPFTVPMASKSGSPLSIGAGRRAVGRPPKAAASVESKESARKPRQTAERRAELADRILNALQTAGAPMGVRTLASELHTAADLLAAPLLELRAAGKIAKHGEKRSTTYSLA